MEENKTVSSEKNKERIIFILSILVLGLSVLLISSFLTYTGNVEYRKNQAGENSAGFVLSYYYGIHIGLGGYFLAFILALLFSYFIYRKNQNQSIQYGVMFFIFLATLLVFLIVILFLYSNSMYKCDYLLNSYSCECYYKTGESILDFAVSESNINKCKSITRSCGNIHANDCISAVAAAKKDVSLCDEVIKYAGELSNSAYKLDREECILHVANSTKDESLCEKIRENYGLPVNKHSCINQVRLNIALESGDYSQCYNIDYDGTERSNCFFEFALKLKNESLCSEIPGGDMAYYIHLKEECIKNSEISSNN